MTGTVVGLLLLAAVVVLAYVLPRLPFDDHWD